MSKTVHPLQKSILLPFKMVFLDFFIQIGSPEHNLHSLLSFMVQDSIDLLLDAVRTSNEELAQTWKKSEQWATIEQLCSKSPPSSRRPAVADIRVQLLVIAMDHADDINSLMLYANS